MKIKIFESKTKEELEKIINEFLFDKIIKNVSFSIKQQLDYSFTSTYKYRIDNIYSVCVTYDEYTKK